mmetsp:Transcript_12703/g.28960  ORF Transcript_12703/g.28960 Transcript_12703/m.28960 type:complete len:202 (-) Transcript_12703:384-989(-)
MVQSKRFVRRRSVDHGVARKARCAFRHPLRSRVCIKMPSVYAFSCLRISALSKINVASCCRTTTSTWSSEANSAAWVQMRSMSAFAISISLRKPETDDMLPLFGPMFSMAVSDKRWERAEVCDTSLCVRSIDVLKPCRSCLRISTRTVDRSRWVFSRSLWAADACSFAARISPSLSSLACFSESSATLSDFSSAALSAVRA